jgi:hypothetical protein
MLEPKQLLGPLGRNGAPRYCGLESGGLCHIMDSCTFCAAFSQGRRKIDGRAIALPGSARRAWRDKAPRPRRG